MNDDDICAAAYEEMDRTIAETDGRRFTPLHFTPGNLCDRCRKPSTDLYPTVWKPKRQPKRIIGNLCPECRRTQSSGAANRAQRALKKEREKP